MGPFPVYAPSRSTPTPASRVFRVLRPSRPRWPPPSDGSSRSPPRGIHMLTTGAGPALYHRNRRLPAREVCPNRRNSPRCTHMTRTRRPPSHNDCQRTVNLCQDLNLFEINSDSTCPRFIFRDAASHGTFGLYFEAEKKCWGKVDSSARCSSITGYTWPALIQE